MRPGTVRSNDLPSLACPGCRSPLAFLGVAPGGALASGALACDGCRARWPVDDGLPRLYREDDVRGNDRLLRHFYDGLPFLHDAVVRYTLPLFQEGSLRFDDGPGSERAFRDGFLRRLALDALAPAAVDGRPLRILEVGAGCGANLPLVRAALPSRALARGLEYWAVDLSAGMLAVLRRGLARDPRAGEVRLLLADAHALPFPDASFDRVFHVGGINGYRDVPRALAEMARVALPGTPIVVGDEQLDPARPHRLFQRATFRLVTFYDRNPHAPVEHLPPGAREVHVEQLSRFLYCLTFSMNG